MNGHEYWTLETLSCRVATLPNVQRFRKVVWFNEGQSGVLTCTIGYTIEDVKIKNLPEL